MNLCEKLTSLHRLIEQRPTDDFSLDVTILNDASRLLLDHQCFSSSDCLVERLALTLCETLCLRMIVNACCGQKTQVLNHYGTFAMDVLSSLPSHSALQLKCSGNHWFGGHDNSHLEPPQGAQYFCSIVLCSAMSSLAFTSPDKDQLNVLDNALKMAAECFNSSHSVIRYLINNDECCLATLLGLLILRDEKLKLVDMFNPLKLFAELLGEIQFDHQVMIDWLLSESVAIICLLRFVKTICAHFSDYKAACKELSVVNHKRARLSEAVVLPCISEDKDRLKVTITERIGDEERQREIFLCLAASSKEHQDTEVQAESGAEPVDYLDASMDCFVRLRLKLDRLSSANLTFSMAPLIRAIERLESAADNDSIQIAVM